MKNKKTHTNIPVYNFLGFRLLEVSYKRPDDASLKSFGIKIIDSNYNKKHNTHVLTTQFSMIFRNEEESSFIFNSGYKINDMNWYNEMKEEQLDALFFSVVFPYIREKIYALSNDYRGSVDIPIIDLRHADLSDGATFIRESDDR